MHDREGHIAQALCVSRIDYRDVGHGVAPAFNDDFNFAHSVVEIVQLLAKVSRSKGDLFKKAAMGKRSRIGITKLGTSFLRCVMGTDLPLITSRFPFHKFNPLFDLFHRHTANLEFYESAFSDADVDACNTRVNSIRTEARSKRFRKLLNDHDRSARKNHASLTRYARKLCSVYPSLFCMRVDLGYREQYRPSLREHDWPPDTYQSRPSPSYEVSKAHRDKFLRSLKKSLPAGLLAGYAWKLEFSQLKFRHFHVMIFVDGQHAREAVRIVEDLRQCWEVSVTVGWGLFENCSRYPNEYPGVGMISKEDLSARASLRQAITYMTMPDCYIKMTTPDRGRTFGKGGMPKQKPRSGSDPAKK